MKKSKQGFTLLEMMIVVVILSILAATIIPKLMSRPEQARRVKAKQDVLTLDNALELYKLDNGFFPSTEQGLDALLHRPHGAPLPSQWQAYINHLPHDPWGGNYHYRNPGLHGEVDVFTYDKHSKSADGKNSKLIIGNW